MSSELQWRSAIRADRAALMSFRCTVAGKRNPQLRWALEHPKPWEYRVQSAIRSLRPAYRPPKYMLVGLDEEGVAAVAYFQEIDGPEAWHINLIGIATRHRGSDDRRVVKELGDEVQARIIERAQEALVDRVVVSAFVHPDNEASQRFADEADIQPTGVNEAGLELYSAEYFLVFD